MRSNMQIDISPTATPQYRAYRQDQDTTATLFQVDLNADTRLTVVEYAPGELINVRMTQDAVGGHLVNWVGATFEGDVSLLVPDPTAGSSSFVLFVCRTETVLEIIGGGASIVPPTGQGFIFVPNFAALLLVDGGPLNTGTKAFVGTLKDYFILDKASAIAPQTLVTGDAIGGGQWLRALQPDKFWLYQNFFVDPRTGNDENIGTALLPLASAEEWKRRVLTQTWADLSGVFMALNIVADLPGAFTLDLSALGAKDDVNITVNGSLGGVKVINNVAITAVTTAAPGPGAGGVDGTIATAATSFAASVGKIGIINAGPRTGAMFAILADLGGNTARIGNVGTGFDDDTQVTLQIGDTFDTWTWPLLGDWVVSGTINQTSLQFSGVNLGSLFLTGTQQTNLTGCVVTGVFVPQDVGVTQAFNCVFLQSIGAFYGARVLLAGGGSTTGMTCNDGSTISLRRFTMQTGRLQCGEGIATYELTDWLGSFDCGFGTLLLQDSCSFLCRVGARAYGQNIDVNEALIVFPGGSYFYADATRMPNFTGTGAFSVIGGTIVPLADLPARHALSTAQIVSANGGDDGSTVTLVGGPTATQNRQVQIPSVTAVAPAMNTDLRVSNIFKLSGPLAVDSALTWTNTPDLTTPKREQTWLLSYAPATHHLTFPGAFISAADLAAINALEATAATMNLQFYCGTDGRIYLLGFAGV